MKMTNSGGQSIGGVDGDFLGQVQQRVDHPLDLFFRRLPIPDDGEFDLAGGIFVNRGAVLPGRQQRDATGLPQLERALRVSGEEYFFQADAIGFVILQGFLNSLVDASQASAVILDAGGVYGAVRQMPESRSGSFDNPPAGDYGPGVDTHDSLNGE